MLEEEIYLYISNLQHLQQFPCIGIYIPFCWRLSRDTVLTLKQKARIILLINYGLTFPFTYFSAFIAFRTILLYLTIVRKNAFEKRLALFNPTRQLSQERQAYMQKVYKYCKYFNSILLIIFYLPLCFFYNLNNQRKI